MHRRQPLPRLWLMTDERQEEAIWAALDRLPSESGVVFRHYSVARPARKSLLKRIAHIAKRKRLFLLVAGEQLIRADGMHGASGFGRGSLRSAPAHNLAEIRRAERAGADILFLSPVFPTRSHPGARTLGRVRFGLLARQTRLPVIALGGMNGRKARSLPGAYGWAAIDAWSSAGTEGPLNH